MRMLAVGRWLTSLTLSIIAVGPSFAAPRAMPPLVHQFEWVDLRRCSMPSTPPDAIPPETGERFGYQRRFLALDEGRPCVLVELGIYQIAGTRSPKDRVLSVSHYRFEQGRWLASPGCVCNFRYFPYALRRKHDRKLFYVYAPLREDMGGLLAVEPWMPVVAYRRPPDPSGSANTPWPLEIAAEPDGLVLQGLAVLLNQRRKAGLLPVHTWAQAETERLRVVRLLQSAWETVPVERRVKLSSRGLPR